MCENRGERRKRTFNKANKHAKLYENITGCSDIGEIGRFKKDKHIEKNKVDDEKTNGNLNFKRNYRHSDMKKIEDLDEQIIDFSKLNKDFLYIVDDTRG